jgi:flagellar hook-length control protein FliK
MSAAATGAAAIASGFANSSDAPSASTDELATPAIGNVGQVAAGANGTPVAALTAAAAAAASAAAVQAAKGFADAGASDKRGTDAGDNGAAAASTKSADAATTGATVGADGTQAGAAAQSSFNIPSATDAAPAANLKVSAGIDTPEFGQGFADRVSYMVDNNLSSAKLQVNPPQLGPIEVRIAVQGGHAQVWLTSHSAVTRDALESSSPKLREMLGAQGFGQVSVDISQRSFQERPNTPPAYDWASASSRGGSSAASSVSAAAAPASRISNSAVDAYA